MIYSFTELRSKIDIESDYSVFSEVLFDRGKVSVVKATMPYFTSSSADSVCLECKADFGDGALRCADCGGGVHVSCSRLPRLFLVRLAVTRATFACSDCIRAKAGEKLQEILDEIDTHMRRSPAQEGESRRENAENLEKDTSTLDAPSAPPASQMPSTQLVLDGGETDARNDWVGFDPESTAGRSVDRDCTAEVSMGPHKGGQKRPRQVGQAGSRAGGSTFVKRRESFKGDDRSICRYYKGGSCKFGLKGEGCKFAHPKKCYKFLQFGSDEKRGCQSGVCPYFHPPLCRATESGRGCSRENCKFYHRRAAKALNTRNGKTNKSTQNYARKYPGSEPRQVGKEGLRAETPSYAAVASRNALMQTAINEPLIPRTERKTDTYDLHYPDFRLLQDQMARMERQLFHLLSLGELEGGGRRRHPREFRESYF